MQKVLAYDLGGTKVIAAIVNSRGQILDELREPVELKKGRRAVIAQMIRMGNRLKSHHTHISRVGLASAGPLDPRTGELLNPTNFVDANGKRWGKFNLAAAISKGLKLPVTMDNDAACAIQAESWLGAAKKYKNAMILTLGTGLGTGVICNGKLVRAGRFLHTEAGHLIIRVGDPTASCGCGNFGCAEAYLSGSGFARRANTISKKNLTAYEWTRLAKEGNKGAAKFFDEYAENLAVAIHNYSVIYAPEIVILAGGFASEHGLFLTKTKKILKILLLSRREGVDLYPIIEVSPLDDRACLLGGAKIAFNKVNN